MYELPILGMGMRAAGVLQQRRLGDGQAYLNTRSSWRRDGVRLTGLSV
jgi:hypothetical protein